MAKSTKTKSHHSTEIIKKEFLPEQDFDEEFEEDFDAEEKQDYDDGDEPIYE